MGDFLWIDLGYSKCVRVYVAGHVVFALHGLRRGNDGDFFFRVRTALTSSTTLTTMRTATFVVGKTTTSSRANSNRVRSRGGVVVVVASAVARRAKVDDAMTSALAAVAAVDDADIVGADGSSSSSSSSYTASRSDELPTSIGRITVTGRRRAMMRFVGACVAAVGWASGTQPSEARAMATVRAERAIRRDGGEVEFTVQLPSGYHFTEGANSRFEVTGGNTGKLFADAKGEPVTATRNVKVDAGAIGDADTVRVECTVYFCREDDVCLLQRVRFEVPVSESGEDVSRLSFAVPPEASDSPMAAVPSFD